MTFTITLGFLSLAAQDSVICGLEAMRVEIEAKETPTTMQGKKNIESMLYLESQTLGEETFRDIQQQLLQLKNPHPEFLRVSHFILALTLA